MAKIDENVKVMMLKGETGSSIKSIGKTATDGPVDTYTVTMTDGSRSNFTVTNGRDGADFDTFEIGGRNLARNSAKLDISPSKGDSYIGPYGGATIKDMGNGFRAAYADGPYEGVGVYANCLGLSSGDHLVFSSAIEPSGIDSSVYFYAMGFDASGKRVYELLYIDSSTVLGGSKKLATVKDGDSKRVSVSLEWTAKAKSLIDSGGSIELTFQAAQDFVSGPGNSISFYAPMLERSTKPSDWTPAPEDKADEADLQSLSTKVTANTTNISKNTNDILTLSTIAALYSDDSWRVCAKCGFVWVYCNGASTSGGAWDYTDCPYTLPEKYRPPMTLYAPAFANNGGTDTGAISVTKDGEISVGNYGGTGSTGARYGVLCYPIGI